MATKKKTTKKTVAKPTPKAVPPVAAAARLHGPTEKDLADPNFELLGKPDDPQALSYARARAALRRGSRQVRCLKRCPTTLGRMERGAGVRLPNAECDAMIRGRMAEEMP